VSDDLSDTLCCWAEFDGPFDSFRYIR